MLNTDPEVLRFISELEFVQSLANPEYLHYLSNAGYFQKPAFMNYLRYLEYWRQPEYILHLIYPQCLRVLECLKDPLFVNSLSCYDAITAIKVQQGNSWIGQRRKPQDYSQIIHQFTTLIDQMNPPKGRIAPPVFNPMDTEVEES